MRVRVELDRGDGLVLPFEIHVPYGFSLDELNDERAALERVLRARYEVAWWQTPKEER
jgi:hypothetical protein